MPRYDNVQFVAWEVYTGPTHDMSENAIEYAGIKSPAIDRRFDILSQCVDVSARIEFTKKAIDLAYANANPAEDVLKIFMAPEFLYRGAGGAYASQLIGGWAASPFPGLPAPYSGAWGGLFEGLKDLVADDKFKDWIFVFGTAVATVYQVQKGKIVEEPKDGSAPVRCINAALIQCGGAAHRKDFHVSMKSLKSAIDFITLHIEFPTLVNPDPLVYRDPAVSAYSSDFLSLLENMTVADGGAVFAFEHIRHADGKRVRFGIEVCLDHIGYGMYKKYGKLCNAGQRVDIQLVPSGGMTLQEASVSLLPMSGDRLESYAFNCDGLTNLNRTEWGTHVQLWNQLADNTCIRLVGVDSDSTPDSTTYLPITGTVAVPTEPRLPPYYVQDAIPGDLLWTSIVPINHKHSNLDPALLKRWPKGAGFIRVLAVQALDPIGPAAF